MLLFPPKPFLSQSFPTLHLYSLRPPHHHTPKYPKLLPQQPLYGFSHLRCSRPFPLTASVVNESVICNDDEFKVELDRLLGLLPEELRTPVYNHPELRDLVEVVMDLGRKPLARFPSGDIELSDSPITFQDIEFATSQVGDFAVDNRAGISHTLHRISAIRNRKGDIIGLTCRVGRTVTGSADLLRDLVKDGASLLLIGPPGVGKTTIIREIARMLADDYQKRVMIVDTSNEIGGDGNIPHAGIGCARRMQVPDSDMQHKVLIEAVENHMPQVIVIDEIGTKLEAIAASTIAQRGIQLVATAHGITIRNLVMNPSLDMLVGGIQSVTLGDEEASRRRGQKTVLERKGPATFKSGVELISKTELRVHRNLEATVDIILAGRTPQYELRKGNHEGEGSTEGESIIHEALSDASYYEARYDDVSPATETSADHEDVVSKSRATSEISELELPIRLFIHGIMDTTVMQGIKKLKLDHKIMLTDKITEADALLASQTKFKRNPKIQAASDSHDIPVYTTKTGSPIQVMKAICRLMDDHEDELRNLELGELEDGPSLSEKMDALEEARLAVEQVVIPKGESMELLGRPQEILLLQMKLVQGYHLKSEIVGHDLEGKRLRILASHSEVQSTEGEEEEEDDDDHHNASQLDKYMSGNGDLNGMSRSVDRLPLLPEYQSE